MAARTDHRRPARGALTPATPVNPAAGLLAALLETGIRPVDPGCIVADGRLHRFDVEGDKRGSRNGWAVLYADHGAAGSWKTGATATWTARRQRHLTRAEQDRLHASMRAAKAEAQRQREVEQDEAAQRAAALWSRAKPADSAHPYLLRKGVTPGCARQIGDLLVLPVQDFDGALRSLQFISANGAKKLLRGGAKRGHFILVTGGLPAALLVIGEGFATCATVARDFPGAAVLAAIDCGNLEAVATGARRRYPEAHIVIAADDDRQTTGNPGLTKAREAARAAGATLIRPAWPPGAPPGLSDFNDLACWQAAAAVEMEAIHA
jgi:putative DNA primase/helicase